MLCVLVSFAVGDVHTVVRYKYKYHNVVSGFCWSITLSHHRLPVLKSESTVTGYRLQDAFRTRDIVPSRPFDRLLDRQRQRFERRLRSTIITSQRISLLSSSLLTSPCDKGRQTHL